MVDIMTKVKVVKSRNKATIPYAKFGRQLATMRERAGLTQSQLALLVSVRWKEEVSGYETGRKRIPSARLMSWAAALKVDPCDFAKLALQSYDLQAYRLIFGDNEPTLSGDTSALGN